MKKSDETQKISCEKIENLLFQKNLEPLTDYEVELIKSHIQSCQSCLGYKDVMENLTETIRMEQNEGLIPDPLIRDNLVKKMTTLKPKKPKVTAIVWFGLKSFFSYRIPVYKTAVGALSIFFIFFLINKFPILSYHTVQKEMIQPIFSSPPQTHVIDDLDILNQQKIGQNVKEDTVITKFIVTVM